MIIEAIKGTTQDNVEVLDSVRMTIDEEATVFLLQSISENLYKNPERAILQELGSNAFDSHIRAQQTRPFEVTLPSALNPVLIIQDWGMGMSKQDIKKVFSKVGGSDKRGTNDERGGYGLGSKSPLAITPSYSLITVKDGEKHTIAVIRDEDGIPDFKFVGYEKTGEPNGVTVCVPVRDIDAMHAAANNLYITYPQGSVLVNGIAPQYSIHNPEQFQRVGEYGWFALDKRAVADFATASGEILGVRYSITPELDGGVVSRVDNAKRIFLSLPNGDVKVETSREGIRAVSQSREHITRVAEGWMKTFRKESKKHLQGCDRIDALIYYSTLPDFIREELTTWHGEDIPRGDVPIFPAQQVEVLDENGEPTGEVETLAARDPRYIRPPYTALVGPGATTRYRAALRTDAGVTHPAPQGRDGLNVVYVLPDGQPTTIAAAERDIRDYERWLRRAGVEDGSSLRRYISIARPEDFSPWFRELVQFVPIEAIEEDAVAERREARRLSAARRARSGEAAKRTQREKRDYTVLSSSLSSSSERARFEQKSMDNTALGEYITGTPETGPGKVTYVIPDANASLENVAGYVARLADRAAHPGRKNAERASDILDFVEEAGYKVISLRASQKLDHLLEDAPGVRPLSEVASEAVAEAAEAFVSEATLLMLREGTEASSIISALAAHIDEIADPMFAQGIQRPGALSRAFLVALRRGARGWWGLSSRERYTEAAMANAELLHLPGSLEQAVKDAHDYISSEVLFNRYPLLEALAKQSKKEKKKAAAHAVLYINAAYAVAAGDDED